MDFPEEEWDIREENERDGKSVCGWNGRFALYENRGRNANKWKHIMEGARKREKSISWES